MEALKTYKGTIALDGISLLSDFLIKNLKLLSTTICLYTILSYFIISKWIPTLKIGAIYFIISVKIYKAYRKNVIEQKCVEVWYHILILLYEKGIFEILFFQNEWRFCQKSEFNETNFVQWKYIGMSFYLFKFLIVWCAR